MNDLTKFDLQGQRLILRADDLKARWLLIDLSEDAYNRGDFDAAASLIHAQYYLEDRLAYELCPAPKGCIKVPLKGGAA